MFSNHALASPRRGVWKHKSDRGRRVVVGAIACLVLAALYCLVSAILLMRVQETTPPVVAAQLQERHGGLYGPADATDLSAYKLERYTLLKPEVLIVGSRRLATLPGEAFLSPAYNAAGVAESVADLAAFTRAAVTRHQPKSILIGLDYWWFHPSASQAPAIVADEKSLALRLLDPLVWLVTGEISVGDFFSGAAPDADTHGIGAHAVLQGEGWDAYGRYDGGTTFGPGASDPALLRDLRAAPAAAALKQLSDLITDLNGRSVEVILMLPPLDASLRTDLARDPENRLLPLWRDAVRALGQRVFDVEDAASLGATDCEFINGISGGEVAYLRTLDAIGHFGGTLFSRAVDTDLVSSLITTNAGHVRIAELLPAEATTESLYRSDACAKDQ